MAVSPYPRYWAAKVDKTEAPYRGYYQPTAEAYVQSTPEQYKTKSAALSAILAVFPRLCACGCEEATKGGEFRMGHDARHKSALIKEALAGGNEEAVAEIERRGWLSHLDKAREVAARPKAEPREQRAKEDEDAEVKARKAHDRLNVIKAACMVLKGVGQYTRASGVQIRLDDVEEAISVLEGGHPDLIHEVTPSHWRMLTDLQVGACGRMRMFFEDGGPFAVWLDQELSAG